MKRAKADAVLTEIVRNGVIAVTEVAEAVDSQAVPG